MKTIYLTFLSLIAVLFLYFVSLKSGVADSTSVSQPSISSVKSALCVGSQTAVNTSIVAISCSNNMSSAFCPQNQVSNGVFSESFNQWYSCTDGWGNPTYCCCSTVYSCYLECTNLTNPNSNCSWQNSP